MNKPTTPRKRQHLAFLLGIGLGLAGLLFLSQRDRFHIRGPMNTGHEDLKCSACHKDAPGTARQQIQANLQFVLGKRQNSADFIHAPVSNKECLECHERPNDNHPVYRFLEPRFLKARQALGPDRCLSCHAEHNGQRVTLTDTGYCRNCHKNTKLRKDPVDVPHDRLIALKLWDSCLGCHDFHGNHIRQPAKSVEKIIPPEKITAYFNGGLSPYGEQRHHPAKKETDDDN